MLYQPLPKDLERQYQEHFDPPSIKHPNHKAMRKRIKAIRQGHLPISLMLKRQEMGI